MKSVMYVSQSPSSRGHYSCERLIHVCTAVRHAVFSREANVTRPGSARLFREDRQNVSPRIVARSDANSSAALYVDLPILKYLLLPMPYKARYVRSFELYDVMRSRALRCAALRDRVSVCAVECAAQQRLIKYEISFTGGKAFTEAPKSIRSWQINAARDISFSRTYDTLIPVECARGTRVYRMHRTALGNHAYTSTCRSTSM